MATRLFFLFVLILFLLQIASAIDFDILYPNEINLDEEFTVKIEANTEEEYDVKIYVHDDTKEFSEIHDGTAWRSPYKFLLSIFPSKNEFLLISHYGGETQLCVKLRKSMDTQDVSEICGLIKVIANQEDEDEWEESEEEANEENKEDEGALEKDNEVEEIPLPTGNNSSREFLSEEQNTQQERIMLNSPKNQESANENKIVITRQQKIRLGVIYAFAIFCVFVIILLALRKL